MPRRDLCGTESTSLDPYSDHSFSASSFVTFESFVAGSSAAESAIEAGFESRFEPRFEPRDPRRQCRRAFRVVRPLRSDRTGIVPLRVPG
jgi:hypothetical protein